MTVPVEPRGTTWSAGTATKLVEGRYYTGAGLYFSRHYDVAPDGQRFLMIQGGRRRRDRRAREPHRRPQLGRGAEAPRADELTLPRQSSPEPGTPGLLLISRQGFTDESADKCRRLVPFLARVTLAPPLALSLSQFFGMRKGQKH